MIAVYFLLVCTLVYAAFILWCNYYWLKIPDHSLEPLTEFETKVAVIIPVRNEIQNIEHLLRALLVQDYPAKKFEIVVIDDHSSDGTFAATEQFFEKVKNVLATCFHSPFTSKKKAIEYGLSKTNAELILTTDADTLPGRQWITSCVREFTSGEKYFVSGPVKLGGKKSIFYRLQQAEFAGLVGIGAATLAGGKPIMCNGANLAYSKIVFDEVGGFDNSKSVSGDDTQLLLKVHKMYPDRLSFLKDKRAIVETAAAGGRHFFQQRRRWASKIPSSLSPFAVCIAATAWVVHAGLLILFIAAFFQHSFIPFLFLITIKTIPEIIFLNSLGKFFTERFSALLIILAQPFYCLYIFSIGILLPFGGFEWKGRKEK